MSSSTNQSIITQNNSIPNPTVATGSSNSKVSLVSTISKVAANLLFAIVVLLPVTMPLVVGGKKITKRTTKKIK